MRKGDAKKKCLGYLFGVHCCRCDNQLQISPSRQNFEVASARQLTAPTLDELTFPQQTHQYVSAEGALMCLIQDDYAVPV